MAEDKMTIDARFEYLRIMQARYRQADRRAKSRLLDQMEAVTHLGRKHLIALMNRPDLRRRPRRRERGRVYGEDVVGAIAVVAETLDWICAERLQPALRPTAEHLVTWNELETTPEVLAKLGRISIATVGRILTQIRPTQRLPRAYPGRRAETSAQQAVPVGVIPWDVTEPGHFEIDLVHHGAPDAEGKLVCTLQVVDVLTGWSERQALLGYDFEALWHALERFKAHCPLPIRELHSDNGSEFLNLPLVAYFGRELVGTRQSRGRPGHHNDNRFVEQKNSSLVRAYLGSLPLHTPAHRRALNALYEDMWRYYNLFQPVLRQTERTATTGADGITRLRRRQDRASTPLQRLLAAQPPVSRQTRERLQTLYAETNPLALKRRIHRQVEELVRLVTASEEESITPV